MSKKELERRYFKADLETREENGIGFIEGRPIVYNSQTDLGYFDEIIESGALNGANLNDVRLCLNHDTSYVYARSRRNNPNSTMRLNPDELGMTISAGLNIQSSPKAQDYYSAVQRRDITGMSFMFSVADEEWERLDTEHPLRRIKKIDSVVEVSAVTFPAYDATDIQARSKEALENARSAVEIARQQKAETVDTDKSILDLEKEKTKILSKGV